MESTTSLPLHKDFKTPSESVDGKKKTTGLPDSPEDPREGMDVKIARGGQSQTKNQAPDPYPPRYIPEPDPTPIRVPPERPEQPVPPVYPGPEHPHPRPIPDPNPEPAPRPPIEREH